MKDKRRQKRLNRIYAKKIALVKRLVFARHSVFSATQFEPGKLELLHKYTGRLLAERSKANTYLIARDAAKVRPITATLHGVLGHIDPMGVVQIKTDLYDRERMERNLWALYRIAPHVRFIESRHGLTMQWRHGQCELYDKNVKQSIKVGPFIICFYMLRNTGPDGYRLCLKKQSNTLITGGLMHPHALWNHGGVCTGAAEAPLYAAADKFEFVAIYRLLDRFFSGHNDGGNSTYQRMFISEKKRLEAIAPYTCPKCKKATILTNGRTCHMCGAGMCVLCYEECMDCGKYLCEKCQKEHTLQQEAPYSKLEIKKCMPYFQCADCGQYEHRRYGVDRDRKAGRVLVCRVCVDKKIAQRQQKPQTVIIEEKAPF